MRILLRGLVGALGLLVLAAMPARGHHLPGEIIAKRFEVTIEASGRYDAQVNDTSGGSWVINGNPRWKVIYPSVLVPITDNATLAAQADYQRSPGDGGPVSWSGTTDYNAMAPPDPFSCNGVLAGPAQIGKSFEYRDSVIASGETVQFELGTLNEMVMIGGSCAPPIASAFTPWSTDLRNFTQAFTTIPRQELFEDDNIQRPVAPGGSNAFPTCTVQGSCTNSMSWSGSMRLVKNCRNYAGSANNANAGPTPVSVAFCESDCNDASCSQEDFEVPPLAHPAKEKGGKVPFVVSCYGDSACDGKLALSGSAGGSKKPVKLGGANFGVAPTAHADVKLKLSKAGKDALKEDDKLSGTLKATITGDVAEATDKLKVKIRD